MDRLKTRADRPHRLCGRSAPAIRVPCFPSRFIAVGVNPNIRCGSSAINRVRRCRRSRTLCLILGQLDSGQVGEIVVSGNHVALLAISLGEAMKRKSASMVRFGIVQEMLGTFRWQVVVARGRCSALVCDDRGTLFPFAVECAAQSYSGVRRAALTTYADRRLLCLEADHSFSLFPDLARLRRDSELGHLDAVKLYPALPVDRRHNAKFDYPALHQMLKRSHSEGPRYGRAVWPSDPRQRFLKRRRGGAVGHAG